MIFLTYLRRWPNINLDHKNGIDLCLSICHNVTTAITQQIALERHIMISIEHDCNNAHQQFFDFFASPDDNIFLGGMTEEDKKSWILTYDNYRGE